MDIFIDKFAQRKNAQEMIKANYMAEAEENERLTARLHRYEDALQEMRRLSYQNMENAEKIKLLLNESLQKIQEVQCVAPLVDNTALEEAWKTQFEALSESFKEMQMKVEETLGKPQEQTNIEELFLSQKKTMEDLEKASEDFMHRESVKVYRNVQAVLEEELPKQTGEITEKVEQVIKQSKSTGGVLAVGIITLLATLANLGVLIAHLWGLF